MQKVIFEYLIKNQSIIADKSHNEINTASLNELKGIANGKIFIFFEPQGKFIILKTGIIDYLIQLNGVINSIDSGNYKTFAVSCDYYSNNLDFSYNNVDGTLRIYEVNGGDFEIFTSFKVFKFAFQKFFKYTMNELIDYYPELANNEIFKKLF